MATWHDRLQRALGARGKTWGDLVAATGLHESSVYAWQPNATKRTTMMNGDNSARVCAYLRINPLWLFDGTGPSGLEDAPVVDQHLETLNRLRALPPDEARAISTIVAALAKL